MQFLQKYLSYWPILTGSLFFFLLGLWLWSVSERAMEHSPKTLNWLGEYRRPGFPFRRERLPFRRICWPAMIGIAFAAALFQYLIRCNTIHCITARWMIPTLSRYDLVIFVLSALGAAAIYLCLHLLYESTFAAVWGALLFVLSPLESRGPVSMLAIILLLVLLYLRTEKAGFPGELLYLAAVACLCMTVSVCLPALWLVPMLIAVHLYKLFWSAKNNRIRTPMLLLALLAALLCWAVFGAAAIPVRILVLSGFSLTGTRAALSTLPVSDLFGHLKRALGIELLGLPRPGMLLNPLIDAPLLGLGLWGCVSAIGMIAKRRSVRGAAAVAAAAAIGLVWLISARYLLPVSFALLLGAMLKNADIGKRRGIASTFCWLGVLYDFVILAATWLLPMSGELLYRLLHV